MDAVAIQRVRTFNRTVSERTGAMSDSFLGRGRPLGESRTLWEIGLDAVEIRELRDRLGLDSGYASRVLQSLASQGLLEVEASSDDGRVRRVKLTRAGRAERAELDRRSDEVAWSLLEPLTNTQRERLLSAMIEVERLLRASMITIALEDAASPDAGWCIEQYFVELDQRFDAGFDPSQSITAAPEEMTPPAGALYIARLRRKPIGCAGLKFYPDALADVKRMWVAPAARGLGLGRRLLDRVERHAKESDVEILRLETNRSLKEAIHLYLSSGYREVPAFNDEPYAHHWFEKRLSD